MVLLDYRGTAKTTCALIKNGTCVNATDTFVADVWIEDEKIAAIVSPGRALGHPDRVIDAAGKYVMPGLEVWM